MGQLSAIELRGGAFERGLRLTTARCVKMGGRENRDIVFLSFNQEKGSLKKITPSRASLFRWYHLGM